MTYTFEDLLEEQESILDYSTKKDVIFYGQISRLFKRKQDLLMV